MAQVISKTNSIFIACCISILLFCGCCSICCFTSSFSHGNSTLQNENLSNSLILPTSSPKLTVNVAPLLVINPNPPKLSPAPTPRSVITPIPPAENPSPIQQKQCSNDATAQCCDNSCSYSAHHQGACSHHGGVCLWIN